jgi:hypothetical protein
MIQLKFYVQLLKQIAFMKVEDLKNIFLIFIDVFKLIF